MTVFSPASILYTKGGASSKLACKVLTSAAALLMLVSALTVGTVVAIAHGQNDWAREQGLFFAEKALKIRQDNLKKSISDYAFWGDAYQNLHARVDLEWAYTRRNLGATLFRDFAYEGVFVVTPDDQTVYAVIEGKLQATPAQQWLQGDITDLLEQAREQAADEESLTRIFQVAGRPALVAAAGLTPGGDPTVREVPGAPSVLLFVDVLSPAKLLALGNDYALKQMRLARDVEDAALSPGLRLQTVGASSLLLRWDPVLPGNVLLTFLLPLLGVAALIIGALGWRVVHHTLASARLLDDSYSSLSTSEARFHDIAEACSDWLWEADAEQRLIYLSERFEAITGHAREAWLGRPLCEFLEFESDSLASWVASPVVQTNARTPLQCSYRSASGKLSLCILVVRVMNGPAGASGYRGTASDITAEVESQLRIQQLQQYDALTGLPNRKHLQDTLERRLKTHRFRDNPLTLLAINIEHFKYINSSLGRAVGDQILVELSQRLEQFLRNEDYLARPTSDEFIVLLNGGFSRQEVIALLCKRLIECVERSFIVDHQEVFLRIRIGIAIAPKDADTAHELLHYAEIALHQARSLKHSRWCFFTHEMGRHITEEKQLENELRHAISNGELRLHFQPRYRTTDKHLSGVEALVRWQHPQRGLLSPGAFISLAERTGLIVSLGTWVLRQACLQTLNLAEPIFVSVNLSPEQFRATDLVVQVQGILSETGLPATRLELEITESMMFDDAEGALTTLNELKALGVSLSMDDFGTGYSSLSYLRRYPFDTLKIDRSFIAQLDGSDSSLAIVHAIIWLGHAMSMRVTAEGVENAEQLTLLRDMGCDEVQGFHLNRPMTAEQLCSLLAREHTNTIDA